jgi:hypothetical protein
MRVRNRISNRLLNSRLRVMLFRSGVPMSAEIAPQTNTRDENHIHRSTRLREKGFADQA